MRLPRQTVGGVARRRRPHVVRLQHCGTTVLHASSLTQHLQLEDAVEQLLDLALVLGGGGHDGCECCLGVGDLDRQLPDLACLGRAANVGTNTIGVAG